MVLSAAGGVQAHGPVALSRLVYAVGTCEESQEGGVETKHRYNYGIRRPPPALEMAYMIDCNAVETVGGYGLVLTSFSGL